MTDAKTRICLLNDEIESAQTEFKYLANKDKNSEEIFLYHKESFSIVFVKYLTIPKFELK